MPTPYIGITGFTDRAQVHEILSTFDSYMPTNKKRLLHVGVMMAHKTLHGIPSKRGWENIFPKKEKVESIFLKDPSLLNVLHFADYDPRSSVDVLHDLCLATTYGGCNMDAIQLDMIWPEPSAVIAYRRRHPEKLVILQINPDAFKIIDYDQTALIAKLAEYEESVDYVLLDKSVGQGLSMNAQELMPFVRAIMKGPYANKLRGGKGPVGVVVAGGLGPETLHLVECLVQEYPDISIDAQGNLCPSGTSFDFIDLNLATKYLTKAICELFYP